MEFFEHLIHLHQLLLLIYQGLQHHRSAKAYWRCYIHMYIYIASKIFFFFLSMTHVLSYKFHIWCFNPRKQQESNRVLISFTLASLIILFKIYISYYKLVTAAMKSKLKQSPEEIFRKYWQLSLHNLPADLCRLQFSVLLKPCGAVWILVQKLSEHWCHCPSQQRFSSFCIHPRESIWLQEPNQQRHHI